MSTDPSENKSWPDPKDFGLPYVEVKPIDPQLKEEKVDVVPEPKDETPEVAPIIVEEKAETPAVKASESEQVEAGKVVEQTAPEKEVAETKEIPKKETVQPDPKKSNSWVGVVIVLAVLVISVIVWQLMGSQATVSEKVASNSTQESSNSVTEAASPAVENTPTEEIQVADNQDSIPKSNSSLEEPTKTPQTGTTIDRTGTESLIRVEGRAERPRYFIVVGSLPNERMAISESAQYLERASSVYLILPYEDVKNHRLAIGQFTSFRKASEELDQIKDQYTEALWILKY